MGATNNHTCNKEQEITEMHEMLGRIDTAIRGNGKPGIMTQIAVMKVTLAAIVVLNGVIVKTLITDWASK